MATIACNSVWCWLPILAFLGLFWAFLAIFGAKLLDNPRENIETGVVWHTMRAYCRWMHRLQVVGAEYVPCARRPGPVIVVANHSAGIDPLLIQSAVPFEVRFMMASDMQPALLEPLWRWTGVISVDRDAGDTKAAREAIRYLQSTNDLQADGTISSGVIGIFPEGAIQRNLGELLPFLPGIGLLVHRSRARVLMVVIRGTPRTQSAWGSLTQSSRSSIEFLPMIDYQATGMKPAEIAADLQRRFLERTGWQLTRLRPSGD